MESKFMFIVALLASSLLPLPTQSGELACTPRSKFDAAVQEIRSLQEEQGRLMREKLDVIEPKAAAYKEAQECTHPGIDVVGMLSAGLGGCNDKINEYNNLVMRANGIQERIEFSTNLIQLKLTTLSFAKVCAEQ